MSSGGVGTTSKPSIGGGSAPEENHIVSLSDEAPREGERIGCEPLDQSPGHPLPQSDGQKKRQDGSRTSALPLEP